MLSEWTFPMELTRCVLYYFFEIYRQTHKEQYHAATIKNIREYLATSKSAKTVAILLDTKGPEIR